MAPDESFSTSSMIGACVTSPGGEEIGSLSDVVIDVSTGRLRLAVIALHGQDRLVAVPWESVTLRPADRTASVAVSPEKLRMSPTFVRNEWPRVTEAGRDRETYDYDGYRPHWEAFPEQESLSYEARRRHVLPSAVGVLLLFAIAGLAYLLYWQGWSTTSAQVRGVAAAVRETTDAVRETSSEVAATAKVKAALALSKRISAFDVDVDTHDAVVTLRGHVPSPEVHELAGEIAGDTSGVREVRNLLTVDPGARPDPERERLALRVEELERQVALTTALQQDAEMEGSKINVRVIGDVATLEGTTVSPAQKARAERIVNSFAGVREVRDNLR